MDWQYAEFMMGHKGALYNYVKPKGPEFLRNIYRAAALGRRRKTQSSRLDLLKELVRGFGIDPEKVLVKEAIAEAHQGVATGDNTEAQIQAMLRTLKQGLLAELKPETSQ